MPDPTLGVTNGSRYSQNCIFSSVSWGIWVGEIGRSYGRSYDKERERVRIIEWRVSERENGYGEIECWSHSISHLSFISVITSSQLPWFVAGMGSSFLCAVYNRVIVNWSRNSGERYRDSTPPHARDIPLLILPASVPLSSSLFLSQSLPFFGLHLIMATRRARRYSDSEVQDDDISFRPDTPAAPPRPSAPTSSAYDRAASSVAVGNGSGSISVVSQSDQVDRLCRTVEMLLQMHTGGLTNPTVAQSVSQPVVQSSATVPPLPTARLRFSTGPSEDTPREMREPFVRPTPVLPFSLLNELLPLPLSL
jgi:hypothetical protein